jgi:hypothetical protein
MRRIVLSLAAAAFTLAAAPAFAATGSLSPDDAKALCSKLDTQFQDIAPFKKGLPYWQKADTAYLTGKEDCHDGKPVAGAEAMRTAISDMYVAPDTL